jgi:hypothetical protein
MASSSSGTGPHDGLAMLGYWPLQWASHAQGLAPNMDSPRLGIGPQGGLSMLGTGPSSGLAALGDWPPQQAHLARGTGNTTDLQ